MILSYDPVNASQVQADVLDAFDREGYSNVAVQVEAITEVPTVAPVSPVAGHKRLTSGAIAGIAVGKISPPPFFFRFFNRKTGVTVFVLAAAAAVAFYVYRSRQIVSTLQKGLELEVLPSDNL